MKFLLVIFFSCLLAQSSSCDEKITLFAAAGLYKPVSEITKIFEKEFPGKVETFFAGSGDLVGRLKMGIGCDIFLPASIEYFDDLADTDLIVKQTIEGFLTHTPVLIVNKKSDKVRVFSDLNKNGVRLALGNPKTAAIGKVSYQILALNNINTTAFVSAPTVNQLLTYVSLGTCDAAIIWGELAKQNSYYKIVKIPKNISKQIAIALTKGGSKRKKAVKFKEYLTSDKSIKIFERRGF